MPRLGLKLFAALAAIACVWVAVAWALSYRYVGVVHLTRTGPGGEVRFAFESDAGRFALVRETRRITAAADSTAWTRWWTIRLDRDNTLRSTLYLNTLTRDKPGSPEIGIASYTDDFTNALLIRYHVPFFALAFLAVAAAWRLLVSAPPPPQRIKPTPPDAPLPDSPPPPPTPS